MDIFSAEKIASLVQKAGLSPVVCATRLGAGMTNLNYMCRLGNGEVYIVRIPGLGSNLLVSREHEYENSKLVNGIGISAELVMFDRRSSIKITKYIESCFLCMGTGSKITVASQVLQKLHLSGIRFGNNFSGLSKMEEYLNKTFRLNITVGDGFWALYDWVKLAYAKGVVSGRPLYPCHNDPVPDNILVDKENRPYLIDWEYSGMNDPLWDLAAYSLESGFAEEEEDFLLGSYFGGKGCRDHQKEIMLLYKITQDALWYLWAKIKVRFGAALDGYADFRLKRGIEMMRLFEAGMRVPVQRA